MKINQGAIANGNGHSHIAKAITLASRIEVAVTESTRIQRNDELTKEKFMLETPRQPSKVKTIGKRQTKVEPNMRMYVKYVATMDNW